MPRPPKVTTEEIKEELKKESNEEEIKKQYLNIQDVQQYDCMDIVAWFVDGQGNKYSRIPELYGMLINEERNESVPTLLMLAFDGTFIPPFLTPGFIGMFPEDHVFATVEQPPEPTKQKENDAQAEAEVELSARGGVQAQSIEKETVTAPPQLPEQPKKTGLFGILKKGKKNEPEKPKEISKEGKDLLDQLNATKTTE